MSDDKRVNPDDNPELYRIYQQAAECVRQDWITQRDCDPKPYEAQVSQIAIYLRRNFVPRVEAVAMAKWMKDVIESEVSIGAYYRSPHPAVVFSRTLLESEARVTTPQSGLHEQS